MTAKDIVVVGVDGTPSGDEALRFALEEARNTGSGVEVVTAWFADPGLVSPYAPESNERMLETFRDQAHERQEQAIERVGEKEAGLTITTRVVNGSAGQVLVGAAQDARMLVVGSRGLGILRAAVLGSTSRYCATHAGCPVVVVPSPEGGTA